MKNKKSALIALCLKLIFSGALVVWVLRRIDPQALVADIAGANLNWLLAAFISGNIGVLIQAWRWRLLTFGLLSFQRSAAYTYIGAFYGTFLPGAVSGDIAKGAALALKHADARQVSLPASIIADRIAGLYGLLCIAFVASLTVASAPEVFSSTVVPLFDFGRAALPLGALLVLSTLPFVVGKTSWIGTLSNYGPRSIRSLLKLTEDTIAQYAKSPALWVKAVAVSNLGHLVNIVTNCMLLLSLGATLSFHEWLVFYTLLSFALMVPISVSGIGLRDWLAVKFMPLAGVSATASVAYAWLGLGLALTIALIGGFFQITELFRPKHTPLQNEAK